MVFFNSKDEFLMNGMTPHTPNTPRDPDHQEALECSICQENYSVGVVDGKGAITAMMVMDETVILPCQHIFGRRCITTWVNDMDKSTCPYCRSLLYAKPEPPITEYMINELYSRYLRGWSVVHVAGIARSISSIIDQQQATWSYSRQYEPENMQYANPVDGRILFVPGIRPSMANFVEWANRHPQAVATGTVFVRVDHFDGVFDPNYTWLMGLDDMDVEADALLNANIFHFDVAIASLRQHHHPQHNQIARVLREEHEFFDDDRVHERDVDEVMYAANVSYTPAARSLVWNEGNVVEAVLALTFV